MGNLVVCCDGTWNTADQKDGEIPTPTNVVRLYNAVASHDAAGVPQQRYYHPGVGTDGNALDKALGGGTGRGLSRNIMSAYKWLAETFRPGDRIFLFGFSRGAYTARSLGGFISRCGLLDLRDTPDAEAWPRVEEVFARGYREADAAKRQGQGAWLARGWAFHGAAGAKLKHHVPIHFIGVWDTVGALGIPDDLLIANLFDDASDHNFHDTVLSTNVLHARHAVAIDEKRASFVPTLWTGTDDHPDVKQVWFPGVHCDVGGGYAETGLSDGALKWMMDEAELKVGGAPTGLAFHSGMRAQLAPKAQALLHDSYRGPFKALRSLPRAVPLLHPDRSAGLVHASALERQAHPPITDGAYRTTHLLAGDKPMTFPVYAADPWNETGLYLEAGTAYRFAATGEWLDSSIKCGPGGTDDGKFEIGEVVQLMGTFIGLAEDVLKKRANNQQPDFVMTRRAERFPWFALTGVIANGGLEPNGDVVEHEFFLIGPGCSHTPARSGYLYCFANDAWHFYGNNRGSVSLTVRREKP